MGLIAALTVGMALAVQNEPVDLGLVLPEKSVIETRIERSERQDDAEWSTSNSTYRIEVRPAGELSYRTVWRDLDDLDAAPMIIITDESLVPARIENLDELMDRLERSLATGGAEAGETSGAAFDLLRGLPPETLTALFLKDFIQIAFGQGTYLNPGERIAYRQPGGSFGDSGPLMMEASFLLESVDPEHDRAVVVWASKLDPAEGRKALPGLIRDMFDLIGDEAGTADKLTMLLADARLVVRTDCRYDIAMATGLAERVECHHLQDIAIAGETQRKETRLTATQELLN